MTPKKDDNAVVALLKKHGIQVVIFDMDQTAVACHSQGRLLRSALPDYLRHTTLAFQRFVPLLYHHGMHLAMATHSDASEYNDDEIRVETHIVGDELARAVVQHCCRNDESMMLAFCIVAYNPRCHADGHDELHRVKRYHMQVIQNRFGVKPHEMLLLDDTEEAIEDCRTYCGVHSVLIDATKRLQENDLFDYLRKLDDTTP
jgi:hypothetical protein